VQAPGRYSFLPLALAIAGGLALGVAAPAAAVQMHYAGDLFIGVLGWLMLPLVFCMLVDGAAALGKQRALGRTGVTLLLYFGAMSLLAMVTGMASGWLLAPGAGMAAVTAVADAGAALPGHGLHADGALPYWLDQLGQLRPPQANSLVVLVLAVPLGLAAGWRAHAAIPHWTGRCRAALSRVVGIVLRFAPLAAFGAMAAAVGHGGLGSLLPLVRFVVAVNLASVLFVVLAYGGAAHLAGVSPARLLACLRGELYLVAFTGSSLAALTPLGLQLERLGCPRRLSDIVLPFSYSLNLAGTYLYIALALVFLAQVGQVRLDWHELAVMLGVGLLGSRGAVGVAGSALATLAATATLLHVVPADTIALLVAVDRTMKCRLLTNVIGHGLACLVVAACDGSLDRQALARGLAR
jgi:aerobic C4-dicarboxylate transport protein